MDEERPVSGISRRSMLKRIGAGAAIAWSAPILSSMRTPAFARHYPGHCDEPCAFTCGQPAQVCGTGTPTFPACLCDQTQESGCFCLNDAPCSVLRSCDSSAECPGGYGCVGIGCCGAPAGKKGYCLPPCGTAAAAGSGTTFAGASV